MPFPAQVDGKFCSVINPDYLYGINIHSKQKPAARAWVDWMLDESDFSATQQAISARQGADLPPGLQPLKANGVKFISLSQAKFGDVNDIDNASEVGLNKPDYRQKLIDLARGSGKGDANTLFADLSKKWSAAAKDAAAGS
jgi:raffinose/stachyose/melibiose transport system substrate-binding protein